MSLLFASAWSGQFIASALAIALPPYWVLAFDRFFPNQGSLVAVFAFAVPLLFQAACAPLWGRLSDRVGRGPMAVRAQLGLAFSTLLFFWVKTPEQFLLVLALQGALSGTYSAHRALLGERASREERARVLARFETAPRWALVASPLLIACFEHYVVSISSFAYASVLPFITVSVLMLALKTSPASAVVESTRKVPSNLALSCDSSAEVRFIRKAIIAIHLGGAVAAASFFAWVREAFHETASWQISLLHSLPSLFLCFSFAPRLKKRFEAFSIFDRLMIQTLILALHGFAPVLGLGSLWFIRGTFALVFAANWLSLNGQWAQAVDHRAMGYESGKLDSAVRFTALAGAVLGAVFWQFAALRSQLPFFAAIVSTVFIAFAFLERRSLEHA